MASVRYQKIPDAETESPITISLEKNEEHKANEAMSQLVITKEDDNASCVEAIMIGEEDDIVEDEIKKSLETGDLGKALEAISRSIREIENTPLHIAVTGEAGAGKSTFINVIRGLEDDEEEGAAKTGVVECTTEPTPYPHPVYKNVIFWDLPGVGTSNFKANEYLEIVNFKSYDFFIIMASERFRLNNAKLAEEIQMMGKKFYFVRTKVDSELLASKKRKKSTFNEEKVLQEIRDDCIQSLCKVGIQEPRVFLLSCLELDKYDFGLMQEILESELPSNKRHVFLISLPNVIIPIVQKKRDMLKKLTWKFALLSCGIAIFEDSDKSLKCDITILVTAVMLYQKAFGLDQDSLEKLARQFDKNVDDLKLVIRSPLALQKINAGLIKSHLSRSGVETLMKVEYVLGLIPLIGALPAGGLSFASTYKMLNGVLKDFAEDAESVLNKAMESSD
ncbi:interferon-gamma-inducible GTPase 10-like isoform X1 [Hyperolius riggenbachi]|uniref:interferon-gamma-inducible GTPase 10-like isoform X1 n=1 Tax=Hyperolius riggenbachi TaxID=752182 RepID=UPI0035A3C7A3